MQSLQDAVAVGSRRLRGIARGIMHTKHSLKEMKPFTMKRQSSASGRGILSEFDKAVERGSMLRANNNRVVPQGIILPRPGKTRIELPPARQPRRKPSKNLETQPRHGKNNNSSNDHRRLHLLSDVPRTLKEALRAVRQTRMNQTERLMRMEKRMASMM